MKTLYAALIGIVALLMMVPLAAAGSKQAFPSWNQQINSPKRFIVLAAFGGAAVLDLETGLVWEQSPETAPNPTTLQTWLEAQSSCNTRNVGGRKGWRLPTLQELASLVDQTQSSPALPSGHPFSNVQSILYWSATTDASDTSEAWGVGFTNGGVGSADKSDVNNKKHVWCVRGGQGVDPQ
jgi:hypothetical protein